MSNNASRTLSAAQKEAKLENQRRRRSLHRESERRRNNQYYALHAEARRASARRYYRAHRKELCERQRRRSKDHPEVLREVSRRYRETHREERAKCYKQWSGTHPEAKRLSEARRRAQKVAVECTLTVAEWRKIKDAYGHRCVYCRKKFKRLTMDHVIPFARGGSHTKENVVPACQPCNSRKFTGSAPSFQRALILEEIN
jgi:5-methylcytosine-specific restriction endonuclease McrA